jgi:hypothetical protein
MKTSFPADELDDFVEGISYQDKCRILKNLIWDVFGYLEDDDRGFIDFHRTPDRVDLAGAALGLKHEFCSDPVPDEETE